MQNPVSDKGLGAEEGGRRRRRERRKARREVLIIPGSKLIVLSGSGVQGPTAQRACREGGVWGAAGQRGLPCPGTLEADLEV